MARRIRDYSADNTTMLNSVGSIATGGGMKMPVDIPPVRVTSRKSMAPSAASVNPSAASRQASNVSAASKLELSGGVSRSKANGDIKPGRTGGRVMDTKTKKGFSSRSAV